MRWAAAIQGEPCSKANSRRLVSFGGKPRVIKSEKALSYSEAFLTQLAFLRPRKQLTGDLCVVIKIWYASRRPDLDESLILDLLQDRKDKKTKTVIPGVYKNDRQVKEKHIFWMGVDKHNPRCEITVDTNIAV